MKVSEFLAVHDYFWQRAREEGRRLEDVANEARPRFEVIQEGLFTQFATGVSPVVNDLRRHGTAEMNSEATEAFHELLAYLREKDPDGSYPATSVPA